MAAAETANPEKRLDALVVGAGFAGVYLLYKLRSLGLKVQAIEAGDDVGGTWYWNRYPGARCDVESLQYSYSFSEDLVREWTWSERYATQPEIHAYIRHVADRFALRPLIQFRTRVVSAVFDESRDRWHVTTQAGDTYDSRYCIMATGALSQARTPDFAGVGLFRGSVYHTGAWPFEGVSFAGRHVGVIGTGSSAVQSIPPIAEEAAHLCVFQRTPNFSVPARNRLLTADQVAAWRCDHDELRRRSRNTRAGVLYESGGMSAIAAEPGERMLEYERRWEAGGANFMYAYDDLYMNEQSNATACAFVAGKITQIVEDPHIAARLVPRDFPIGAKRLCVDTHYYETFNRENVTLVDVRATPITAFTERGIATTDHEYPLDCVVFATGYDAMTGALLSIDIRGADGLSLGDKWAAGARTYLGIMTAGFPNLFMVTGPGSPSVLSNMVMAIEQHVDWIADCLSFLERGELSRIEATQSAEDDWVAHSNEVAALTLYPKANSWYLGANVPGKPRIFMPYVGGFSVYRKRCERVARAGYSGFSLSGVRVCGGPDK